MLYTHAYSITDNAIYTWHSITERSNRIIIMVENQNFLIKELFILTTQIENRNGDSNVIVTR